jgi:hypothetical protein
MFWVALLGAVAFLWIAGAISVDVAFDIAPVYALTYPIGALIFAWMLARSTIVALRDGGITWRGTSYPLEELKRGGG